MAEDADTETDGEKEREKEHDSDHSSCCADDADPNRPDPLEGLDEETKICFQVSLYRLIECCNFSSPVRNWRRKDDSLYCNVGTSI